jgi:hypothetical protein
MRPGALDLWVLIALFTGLVFTPAKAGDSNSPNQTNRRKIDAVFMGENTVRKKQ